MRVIRNPPGSEERYLEALNESFPGWGGEEMWRWAFERPVSGRLADRMVITDDRGEWLAGSAISYRTLGLPDGRQALVGIMTGSWSRPEARGQGCFSRIIEESREWVRDEQGEYLLAFVTAPNASRRRLQAAGSVMFPSQYMSLADQATPGQGESVLEQGAKVSRDLLEELWKTAGPPEPDLCRFHMSEQEWRGQFLDRPTEVRVLRIPEHGAAIVEITPGVVRLLSLHPKRADDRDDLLRSVGCWATEQGKTLFWFRVKPSATNRPPGMRWKSNPGFLTLLSCGEELTASTGVAELATGRRVAPSAWEFFIQNGDRM